MTGSSRVLIVQHEEPCPPGLLRSWLSAAGVDVDVLPAHRGPAVPAALTDHDGLIVLGGAMGAMDDHVAPWLPAVRRLIADTVEAGSPFLGVCLGHQLAAVALGGEVTRNPRGQAGGITPFGSTDAARADPLLHAVAPGAPCLQWNGDVVTALPPGAVPLAYAPDGSVQAVRFADRAWGVQPHPEAGAAIFRGWTTGGPSGPQPREDGIDVVAVAEEVEQRAAELADAWAGFGRRFAEIVTGASGRRDVRPGDVRPATWPGDVAGVSGRRRLPPLPAPVRHLRRVIAGWRCNKALGVPNPGGSAALATLL